MTITVDTDQFLFDSLERILKQTHLNDNYDIGMFAPNEIPSSAKKLAKGVVPADFFSGAKAKIIVLKAKDPAETKDEDSIKIANFVKTTFFLTDDSPFSTNDVYQVKKLSGGKKEKKEDDNEENPEENVEAVYFFVKLELVK